MQQYLQLLANRKFAVLWLGATISILGDALTWTALVWLVYEMTGSTAGIGALVVVYSAPVIVGGLAAGILLDKFDRRAVLIADNAIRGAFIAAIPLLHYLGKLELWHLYLAAGVYGLFKMISLAGIPSIFPSLVEKEKLNTANAMEVLSFGVGGIVGFGIAGALIATVGAANTIAIDAASYFFFVACLATLPRLGEKSAPRATSNSLRPAMEFIRATPAVWFVMAMFMCGNIGEGIMRVFLPVYAKEILRGDAVTFGLLLTAISVGELCGAMLVGGMEWRWTLGRSIAAAQFATGVMLLSLLMLPNFVVMFVVLMIAFAFSAPLTIWAQTIRMRLIPAELRGRVFSLLRTLMQSTPPIGGALGSFLLTGFSVPITILAMGLLVAIPGALGLAHPALEHRQTITGDG